MTTAVLNYLKVQKKELPQADWKIICLVGSLACLLSLIFYVYQVNVLTGGTYIVNSYENKINSILQENKKLEVGFAENSFMGQVLARTQQLDFHKTASVKYIQIADNSVAIKK